VGAGTQTIGRSWSHEVLVAGSFNLIETKIRRARNSLAVAAQFRMFMAGRVELNRPWCMAGYGSNYGI
jgi:hypothetical protein